MPSATMADEAEDVSGNPSAHTAFDNHNPLTRWIPMRNVAAEVSGPDTINVLATPANTPLGQTQA